MGENAWAIVGPLGLYVGTASTRNLAIRQHVWAFDEELYGKPFPMWSQPHSATERRVWAECRKRGDRAVKVTVTIQEAP